MSPAIRTFVRSQTSWLVIVSILLFLAGLGVRGSQLDVALFQQLNAISSSFGTAASWLCVLALGASALVIAAATGPRRPTPAAAVLLGLLVCGGLVQAVKWAFPAGRPLAILGPAGVHVIGVALRAHAMPSGHAAALACAAAMSIAAASASRRWWPVAAVLSLLAILGGLARIVVGAHWPSDVLAGAGVGLLAGTVIVGTATGQRACRSVAAFLCLSGSRATGGVQPRR